MLSIVGLGSSHPWPAPYNSLFCPRNSIGGAHDRTRTGDPVLTKNVLYQLSYVGWSATVAGSPSVPPACYLLKACRSYLVAGAGFEPA